MGDLLAAARAAYSAGLSVVPPREDGTKRPIGEWKQYQTRRASDAQMRAWYVDGRCRGLGAALGAVSGNVEMLEFEGRAVTDGTWAEFCAIATSEGHSELGDRVTDAYLEDTPSGGIHILLRVVGGSALGNSKLASDAGGEVLIETRGEGGYAIFAPSNGGVHPTAGAWALVSGGFETIADVTVGERDTLYDIARRLDRKPRPTAASILSTGVATEETAPWDTFTGTCDDVLIEAGFVYHSTTPDHRLGGDARSYTRPGKDPRDGSSATVWTDGRCTIFSSSVDTPHEVSDRRRLSPWQLHTHLNFDGDFQAAARDARRLTPISRQERQEPARHTGIPSLIVPTIGIGQVQAFAADDLLAWAQTPTEFHIPLAIAKGTHGVVGAAKKSLKTTIVSGDLALSLANKIPWMGHNAFQPNESMPVAVIINEGERSYMRMLARLAKARALDHMGPITVVPANGLHFGNRDLGEVLEQWAEHNGRGGFLIFDAMYGFVGGETRGESLFAMRDAFAQVQDMAAGIDSDLWLVHHLRTTNRGRRGVPDLDELAWAGAAEWADSWVLLTHRQPPKPDVGSFRLGMAAGSRQWGQSLWEIDAELGTYDPDLGDYSHPPQWTVLRVGYDEAERWGGSTRGKTEDDIAAAVSRILATEPWQHTRTDMPQQIGGKAATVRATVNSLIDSGRVVDAKVQYLKDDKKADVKQVLGFAPHMQNTYLYDVAIPDDYPDPPLYGDGE